MTYARPRATPPCNGSAASWIRSVKVFQSRFKTPLGAASTAPISGKAASLGAFRRWSRPTVPRTAMLLETPKEQARAKGIIEVSLARRPRHNARDGRQTAPENLKSNLKPDPHNGVRVLCFRSDFGFRFSRRLGLKLPSSPLFHASPARRAFRHVSATNVSRSHCIRRPLAKEKPTVQPSWKTRQRYQLESAMIRGSERLDRNFDVQVRELGGRDAGETGIRAARCDG